MAGQESRSTTSTFPMPPMQYVNQFTDENVRNDRVPAPPPPLDSNFMMFGAQCAKEDAIIQSLESQGVRRLYPALYDHRRELKKLNFSLLANYLDLIDILIKCPDSTERQQKLEHIRLLFINMHHLINEYRPLQARDTLVEMLTYQGTVTQQTVDTAVKYLSKVDNMLAKAKAELPAAASFADIDEILAELPTAQQSETNRREDEFSSFMSCMDDPQFL